MHSFYRHFHLPDTDTKSVTAYCEVPDGSKDDSYNYYEVSFAVCMPEDNFSRAKGRTIAKNRHGAGKFIRVKQPKGEALIKSILRSIERTMSPHRRIHKDERGDVVFISMRTAKPRWILEEVYNTLHDNHLREDVKVTDDELPDGWYYGKVLPFLMQFSLVRKLANVKW